MRIALATDGLFPHTFGGIQRHSTFLARGLVAAGAEVEVIAPAGHEVGDEPFRVVPLPWPSAPLYPLQLRIWAGRVAAAVVTRGYDVVLGQGLCLWGALPAGSPPSVFHPHGLEFCTVTARIDRLKASPLRFAARREAKAAAAVVSLGGRLTEVVHSCLDVPSERIAVIPNGVDTTQFSPAGSHEPGLVVFVGRLFQNKAPDVLLEAFRFVTAPGARLVLAGDGPMRNALESKCDDSRVTFLGSVTEGDLLALYRRAAMVVVPSRQDGMPTVILEAFACGCPAVAFDVGAIAELVDNETGALVRPGDVESLATEIDRLLTDPHRRDSAGAAARAKVERTFAWPAVVRSTLELLTAAAG